MSNRLFVLLQYLLPHHFLSRLIFWLTRRESALRLPIMRWFVRQFKVDLSEAQESNLANFPTFNAFFTRALREGARPLLGGEKDIACPADGHISQLGEIRDNQIFQAKGHQYSVEELLALENPEDMAAFHGGQFMTVYLSPRDYHRLHMPLSGKLREMVHVPGRLFSVAPGTVANVPRLFARNERVVARFDTEVGPMALVLVGAINVAAIETVWAGLVTPPKGKTVQRWQYKGDASITLARGEEMGRFNMGSTIIVLLPKGVHWNTKLESEMPVRVNQLIGTVGV